MTTVAAIFDVDGTLARTNALHYYLFFVGRLCPPGPRLARWIRLGVRLPYWLLLDRIDRGAFNCSFYRQYAGFRVQHVHQLAEACFREVLQPRLIAETMQRARQHRAVGDRILLVSGSLDVVLEPLAAELGAEAVLCPGLRQQDGVYRGEIAGRNVVGPVKAEVVADYARRHQIDLSKSYAYADSFSDLALLKLVHHAVTINPGSRLRATAMQHGWEQISSSRGKAPSQPSHPTSQAWPIAPEDRDAADG